MPASKRKMDEDTWIIFQSKKSKTSLQTEKIFESTLAKLRHGARACFNPSVTAGPPSWAGSPDSPTSANVSVLDPHVPTVSSTDDKPAEPTNATQGGVKVCSDCQSWNVGSGAVNKCNFCDQLACHVSQCSGCEENFCRNCYIRRYDDPRQDTVTCYSCL